jgi:alpha-amylase
MNQSNSKINFIISVHAHQPVDNFKHVFAKAYKFSYKPFLEVLKKFPEVKISLHISGSLLDWLLKNRSQYIEEIKNLIAKRQIELLGGGYYEPILVLLNDNDKIGQIQYMREELNKIFSSSPKGIWLTERVWEPSLPKPLNEAGVDFVIVDDKHFEIAGYDIEKLDGYYLSEEQNYPIAIFPGAKFLRYSMPFKAVNETINYLEEKREQGIKTITFADDLEKFGFWPKTYHWVYEEGWLESFFEELTKNKDWIKLVSFQEILENSESSGRVYLPCASYSEMMEWSENMFRNFLAKYDESNNIHKKMLYVSRKIKKLEEKNVKVSDDIKINLYKSQNNDVYWHGIFGGLYLANLRDNAYMNLISAEKQIEKLEKVKYPYIEELDFNLDGSKETIYKNKFFNIYFSSDKGGTILELDYKPLNLNLINTLTRRKEKYHDKILQKVKQEAKQTSNSEASSIHNLDFQTQNLEEKIIYDNYRKVCWIDHIFPNEISCENLKRNQVRDLVDFYEKKYKRKTDRKKITFSYNNNIKISKSITLDNDFVKFNHQLNLSSLFSGFFAIEFNFLIYDKELLKKMSNLNEKQKNIILNDEWHKLIYKFSFSIHPFFLYYPIETISYSESGFEKTHQGMSLFFMWDLAEINKTFEVNYSLFIKEK